MPPLEARNHAAIGPERGNIAETQDKSYKITFMNMLEILKEDLNKSIYENTNKQRNEMKKKTSSRYKINKENPN